MTPVTPAQGAGSGQASRLGASRQEAVQPQREGTVNLLVMQASQAFHIRPLYLLAIVSNQGNRKQFG